MGLRIGSLFSGIGGLELGLERSGLGHAVWQVEQNKFCQSVLSRHWPDVERFDDVRTFQGLPADLICGGFPCQDISSAGKGKGLSGDRSGLWFEFARIIGAVRPRWVVVENVASGAKLWVDQVRSHLGELGYETLPIPISAQDVGAPHLRRRIFLVGYTHNAGESTIPQHAKASELPQPAGVAKHPHSARCDQTPTVRADPPHPGLGVISRGRVAPNPNSLPIWERQQKREGATFSGHLSEDWQANDNGGWCPPVSPVHRVDDGIPHRLDRLKALGNAVVPQCAEVVGHVIQGLILDRPPVE